MTAGGTTVVAVDFGASSIRVCRVDLDVTPPDVDVVHRYAHAAVRHTDRSLRWDWLSLVAELERGLTAALDRGPVASIGICTWGVDYGLVDGSGNVLSAPHSYRSERTSGFRDVVERVGARRMYEISGIQLQPFNTIFQLAAHDPSELGDADQLLLLPDLLVAHLTGHRATERTAAGTTGLLDVATGEWSNELIAATGAPRRLFTEIVDAPAVAGTWRGVPVYRVGGHDTASAVFATTGASHAAFVSSGTWFLVGREQPHPDTSPEAQEANFTNELAVGGAIRFLKNVAGLWLIEACRTAWGVADLQLLLRDATAARDGFRVFDTTDARFLAPSDMEAEIRAAGAIAPDAPRAVVVRAALESIAHTTASVIAGLGEVTSVELIGGAARGGHPMIEALRRRTGLEVTRGPVEAAAMGNALVQGLAIGRYADVAQARRAAARPRGDSTTSA